MIPGFASAERAWEAMEPPEDVEECEGGYCGHCVECLAAEAEDEAECYAEAQREERHLEERYGA